MNALDWKLKDGLHHLRDNGRLNVLIALMCHSNARNRCWPSMRLLVKETGWSINEVTAAKDWLIEHGAIELVDYNKRVGDEIGLPKRQHVYQLTGEFTVDGKKHPYFYLAPSDVSSSEISHTEVSSNETEVYQVISYYQLEEEKPFPLATQDGGVDSAIGFDVEEIPSDTSDSLSEPVNSHVARRLSAYQVIIGLIAAELATNDNLDYAALSESSKQGYIGHATALWKKDLKAIHALCKITVDEMAVFIDSRNSAKERLAFPSKDGVLGRAFARWREQSKVVETPVAVKALVPKTLPNGKVVYGEME